MKRRLLKLGLLLLAGAIINVAVALALGRLGHKARVTFDNIGEQVPLNANELALWGARAPVELAQPPVVGFLHSFQGRRYLMMSQVANPADPTDAAFTLWILECGWPFASFGSESWYEIHAKRVTPTRYSGRLIGAVRLPARPLWPGFAINTLFYAGVVWLLFFAPFKIRRWRRIKRGLCPACAYPVGTSDKCTECGKRVTPRSVEAST